MFVHSPDIEKNTFLRKRNVKLNLGVDLATKIFSNGTHTHTHTRQMPFF